MPRTRLLTFLVLTSLIAACTASSPTAPTTTLRAPQPRAQHDDPPPCDSLHLSGYTIPGGNC